jgi:3-hydroxyisobutyrate dehydrogenase
VTTGEIRKADVGFVGLGRMGLPMCARLIGAGRSVVGYDVRDETRGPLNRLGAEWVTSAGGAAERAEVLITMLPGPQEVAGVIDEVASALTAGCTWIDMSTASPAVASAITAAIGTRDIECLDAPVGGGPHAARAGRLLAFVGGKGHVVEAQRHIFEALTERLVHVGGAGAGYTVKLLINLLWFGQAVASAEALALAEKTGIDPDVLRDAVGLSAAATRFMSQDADALLAGASLSSFALGRCCEQLTTVLELGIEMGMPLELAEVVGDIHQRALERYGDVDGELLGARFVGERAGVSLRR